MIGYSETSDDDDQTFNNELHFFRQLEPPANLREKCMIAASAAVSLSHHRSASNRSIAWRRAAMLASATAASLLIGIGIGWSLRGEAESSSINQQIANTPQTASVGEMANARATSTVQYDERIGEATYRQEETYLCGVGRIRSKSMIQLIGE